MARLWSSGAELNSTTSGVEVTTVSGITISSTTTRTGGFSWRCLPSASFNNFRQTFLSANSTVPIYIRSYIRLHVAPTSTTQIILIRDSGGTQRVSIDLTSGRILQLKDQQHGAQVGSNSSALTVDTWYRIELEIDATTPSSTYVEARIDGVSFASGTISLLNGIAELVIGNFTSVNNLDIFYDDIAVNDSTGSFQNSWPGDGKIIHLKPSATGDSNGFLAQVGGTAGATNNFTRVNEIPPDDATSYNGSALLSAEDLFNCDDSGIGASDTVNVVSVGVRMADLVGADATAAFKLEIEKTGSGTKSQSGTLIPNSTTWKTNAAAAPFNYPLTTYQDPNSSNWTKTTLDSMQIGYIQTATNVQTIAVSNVWALVDYTPAAAGGGTTPVAGFMTANSNFWGS